MDAGEGSYWGTGLNGFEIIAESCCVESTSPVYGLNICMYYLFMTYDETFLYIHYIYNYIHMMKLTYTYYIYIKRLYHGWICK